MFRKSQHIRHLTSELASNARGSESRRRDPRTCSRALRQAARVGMMPVDPVDAMFQWTAAGTRQGQHARQMASARS